MTRIIISIVSFGSASRVIDCIKSIEKAKLKCPPPYTIDVYVVDNYSTSENRNSIQKMLQNKEDVIFLPQLTNNGFAAGHNIALNEAFGTGQKVDFVWLLNDDCKIDVDALYLHISQARNEPSTSVWGSTLIDSDTGEVQCAGGCFYNPWLSLYKEYGRGMALSAMKELVVPSFDYIAGASMFIRGSLLERIRRPLNLRTGEFEYLNEDYFLYFEEIDLAMRAGPAAKQGWCKEALVYHVGGASTGTNRAKVSDVAEFNSNLSSLRFTYTHHTKKLIIMALFRFCAKLVQLTLRGQPQAFANVLRAYKRFLKDFFAKKR